MFTPTAEHAMDVLGLTVEFWNIYNEIYTPFIFNTNRLDGNPYAIS